MPKPRTTELIQMPYFPWRVGQRNVVFTADGRSNIPSVGRFSLGKSSRHEALVELKILDARLAVDQGLADHTTILRKDIDRLSPGTGVQLYQQGVMRPGVAGGASTRTWKRYRAVFDKFLLFAQQRPIITWNEVDRTVLLDYNRHLVRLGKSAATQ
jgi:hypothetical protein